MSKGDVISPLISIQNPLGKERPQAAGAVSHHVLWLWSQVVNGEQRLSLARESERTYHEQMFFLHTEVFHVHDITLITCAY